MGNLMSETEAEKDSIQQMLMVTTSLTAVQNAREMLIICSNNFSCFFQCCHIPLRNISVLNSYNGEWDKTGSTRYVAHFWPIVPAPCDCEDGEFGGIKIGRGSRIIRRKHDPPPLCPPQIPLDQTRTQTRAAAVGSHD
jgi:hypothetical protein